MKDTPLINKAKMLAGKAHEGQMRKYSGMPYIVHPIEVATIVQSVDHTDEMIAAALLHDVVEDTEYTVADISKEVSPKVAELVEGLTDVSKPEDGNRKTRKAMDKDHLAKQSAEVQTIKLADVISNSQDIKANDPSFAKVYIEEMKALLEVLDKGDKTLYAKAKEIVYSS
jgi:(p)ppGpp synthase/HD superfamily hydrolase|tara:strand:+ start:921 stop:1430 length:510 start_codon:yes stop_codon:yes gene_type:complete